jgi:hypothetical protein
VTPLTIFSCPKAFRGHIDVIQRNAIQSWLRLVPRPEILLLGDDDGVGEVCREFGLHHLPLLERNEWGTPYVHDIFGRGQAAAADGSHVCYINTDIVIFSEVYTAIERATRWHGGALLTGLRTDLNVNGPIDFTKNDWDSQIRAAARENGVLMRYGVDYLIFRKGFYRDFPPFAIGRTAWDNWLLWYHRKAAVPLVTMTKCVLAIHQNHSTTSDWHQLNQQPEVLKNKAFASEWQRSFTLNDATHELTPDVVRSLRLSVFKNRAAIVWGQVRGRLRSAIRRTIPMGRRAEANNQSDAKP